MVTVSSEAYGCALTASEAPRAPSPLSQALNQRRWAPLAACQCHTRAISMRSQSTLQLPILARSAALARLSPFAPCSSASGFLRGVKVVSDLCWGSGSEKQTGSAGDACLTSASWVTVNLLPFSCYLSQRSQPGSGTVNNHQQRQQLAQHLQKDNNQTLLRERLWFR